jgi:phytoene dehydrogenase-like protein
VARVVVVGAGLGGLATAARLAKLGHHVTVCERGSEPGGLLRRVRHEGFGWDATPFAVTLPAVLRDLFRKSGRPLERYVDLQLSTPARRHVFPDGIVLDLPTGSRGAQLDAVRDALGAKAAGEWTSFVDEQADQWELLRSNVLDVPAGAAQLGERRTARALRTRQRLGRVLGKALADERLRLLASYPVHNAGGSPAHEPALRAVEAYVERTFGVWRSPNGSSDLTQALLVRMGERSVDMMFDTTVAALRVTGDRVTGAVLADGRILASDLLVTAVPPAQVFGGLLDHAVARDAAPLFAPSDQALPRSVTYLGLTGELPALPVEVVLHGDPLLVLSTGAGWSGSGPHAWSLTTIGAARDEVLDILAERGIDLRGAVTARVDSTALPAYPLGWRDARTAVRRARLANPLPGLHCLGTGLVLGSSVPYVAWQAAHVGTLAGLV